MNQKFKNMERKFGNTPTATTTPPKAPAPRWPKGGKGKGQWGKYGKGGKGKNKTSWDERQKQVCSYCSLRGHLTEECRKKKREENPDNFQIKKVNRRSALRVSRAETRLTVYRPLLVRGQF